MISFILPLKNEEKIINYSLTNLINLINNNKIKNYEIICIINNTTDNTKDEINKIKSKRIKIISSKPGYGEAILKGISKSNGDIIVILNADLIDENIIKFAKNKLFGYDLIIGSKRTSYAKDKRPKIRKFFSFIFNLYLKIFFNFKGTDTHGIKAFKKDSFNEIFKIIEKYNNKNDIIDTLIVLAFQLLDKKVMEYPIEVKEIRPSRFSKRIFYVWKDLIDLNILYLKLKKDVKKNFYNKISSNWLNIMNKSEYLKRENLIFNYFLKDVDLKNKIILDAGCGLGLISEKLLEKKAKVYGIDYSLNNINYVRKKFKSKNFYCTSVTNLPFKNNFFDIIIYTEVIEHLNKEEQEKSLQELKRVLKKNGLLVLTTPNKIWRPFFILLEFFKIRPYHGIENWFYINQLKKIIKNNSYSIIKDYHFNFIYPTKFLDFFERFKFLSSLMINQGYLLKK